MTRHLAGLKPKARLNALMNALAESAARFTGIEILVTSESADRDVLERLVQIADRGCIMMNTLRGTLDIRIRIGIAA